MATTRGTNLEPRRVEATFHTLVKSQFQQNFLITSKLPPSKRFMRALVLSMALCRESGEVFSRRRSTRYCSICTSAHIYMYFHNNRTLPMYSTISKC